MLDTYMNAFDLTFLSIYRVNGQEWPLLPGLLALNPPKKIARGRDQDRLLVYLTLAGNISYSANEYLDIATQVAEVFYSTSGSLTFALKTAAESLNTYLVDHNMKSSGKGLYSIGALVLANVRGDSMYIVQSGPTHVYHFSGETRHLNDPQLAGKGLGLGQAARLHFSQVTLTQGDRLLICAALPSDWEATVTTLKNTETLESSRARLLANTRTNVSALLVQVSEGSGMMNVPRAVRDDLVVSNGPVVSVAMPASPPVAAPLNLEELQILDTAPTASPISVLASTSTPVAEAQAPDQPQANDLQPADAKASRSVAPTLIRPAASVPKPARGADARPRPQLNTINQSVSRAAGYLAGLIRDWHKFTQKLVGWFEKAIPRLLPESEEDQPHTLISRSWAIFFTIAIPVLIFVVSGIVYYQLGYEAQFKIYFDRAQQTAQQAAKEKSPSSLRVEWQTTLDWLDKADHYMLKPIPDEQKLRQEAQNALDTLDKIVRLGLTPAFSTPFSHSVQVLRMAASDSDVYLLDSVSGSVLRGVYNNKNFDLDGSFQCGPGPDKDGVQVDKLIDIIALPRSRSYSVSLMGIDLSGKLLLCAPGEKPRAIVLSPPGTGWKGITVIAFDSFNLYVLDAPAHAVWVYSGDEKLEFSEPQFFFGEQVPVMIDQAIDMVVNVDDLYLLHQDGHMAICTFSHLDNSPTRCSDPALYIDSRPGYEGGMNLSDGIFSQMAFTSAPDPSVALLESFTQSVFRFSPRSLELQNQLRAAAGKDNPLPEGQPVTAMAFSPNKIMYLFMNGQLYFSINVP